jgi:hypothetical protein
MNATAENSIRIFKLSKLRDAARSNQRRLNKSGKIPKSEYWNKIANSYQKEIDELR